MRQNTELQDKRYYTRKAITYGLIPRTVDFGSLKKKTIKGMVEQHRARLGKGKTYSMMNVTELRKAINDLNLKNFHKLDKHELVSKLKHHKLETGIGAKHLQQTCHAQSYLGGNSTQPDSYLRSRVALPSRPLM